MKAGAFIQYNSDQVIVSLISEITSQSFLAKSSSFWRVILIRLDHLFCCWQASLVTQPVKNPPAMQETQVLFLGWEDPLAKVTATHSSILAWRTPWTKEPGGLQSLGSQRVWHDGATNIFTFLLVILRLDHLEAPVIDRK